MKKLQVKHQRIGEQAARYVTRLYSGELSAQEEREIANWRQASDQHEQAFQETLELWELSSHLYQPAEAKRTLKRRLSSWSISAAAGVVVAFGLMYLLGSTGTIEQQSDFLADTSKQYEQSAISGGVAEAPQLNERRYLQTGLGEVDTIGLSDGSTVTLNTSTLIQVAFNEGQRNVTLLNGEAYFEVESDQQRPFVIDTGSKKIRVVGTKFNVRRADNEVRVAVVEGKVAVSVSSSAASPTENNTSEAEGDYMLEAGAVGSFTETASVVSPQSYEQVSQLNSWRKGVFRFEDERLDVVVKEFNRYRSKKLRIADPLASDLRISGVFHFGNGGGLVNALEATLPITVEEYGDELIIRRSQ